MISTTSYDTVNSFSKILKITDFSTVLYLINLYFFVLHRGSLNVSFFVLDMVFLNKEILDGRGGNMENFRAGPYFKMGLLHENNWHKIDTNEKQKKNKVEFFNLKNLEHKPLFLRKDGWVYFP